VSPRRTLKPAPLAEVSEAGPYGVLPRIGAGNRKPQNVMRARYRPALSFRHAESWRSSLGGMGLNAELTKKATSTLPAK